VVQAILVPASPKGRTYHLPRFIIATHNLPSSSSHDFGVEMELGCVVGGNVSQKTRAFVLGRVRVVIVYARQKICVAGGLDHGIA
jgi:hypothetical protein